MLVAKSLYLKLNKLSFICTGIILIYLYITYNTNTGEEYTSKVDLVEMLIYILSVIVVAGTHNIIFDYFLQPACPNCASSIKKVKSKKGIKYYQCNNCGYAEYLRAKDKEEDKSG